MLAAELIGEEWAAALAASGHSSPSCLYPRMQLYRGRGRYSDALTLAHMILSGVSSSASTDASIRALGAIKCVALRLTIAQVHAEAGSTAAALV